MNKKFISLYGQSHIGIKRRENQDRFLIRVLNSNFAVMAVADGLGGETSGSLAASTAVDFLDKSLNGNRMDEKDFAGILKKAGDKIISFVEKDENLHGMGTTLTTAGVTQSRAFWAHIGDSRLYHYSDGVLVQISKDHRILQELIDHGDISPQEARNHPLANALEQCIGTPDIHPESGTFAVKEGDYLILTTDGLHEHVHPAIMESVLESSLKLPAMTDILIEEAIASGSRDDLTVVLGLVKKSL
jgi:protein phosphatase